MSTLNKTRHRLWPRDDPRQNRPDTIGPCADSMTSLPPSGTGHGHLRNYYVGQGATHTSFATLFFPGNEALSPWSYLGPFDRDDGINSVDLLKSCQRVAEFGFGGAPPQTYVVSLAARTKELLPNDDETQFPVCNSAAIMSNGRRYTRLQAVIEVGTGTGTMPVFPVDVNGGVVFRVFGSGVRVWALRYPTTRIQIGSTIGPPNPISVPVSEGNGFTVPAGLSPSVTILQASEQSNWRPQEGFPGSWQLTATLSPVNGINVVRIPPFARSVKITQAPGGAAIPAYRINDIAGNAVGTINVPPGSRTSNLELEPGGSYTIENTTTSATSNSQVVFNVSQF